MFTHLNLVVSKNNIGFFIAWIRAMLRMPLNINPFLPTNSSMALHF
jgi:hypothetical protein